MEYITNARQAAEFLGLTERRISQLVVDGVISKLENGKFNLKQISEEYYKFKYDFSDTSKDYETEKARHEAVKRKISEIKLAKMEGTMHEAADVESVMTNMLASMRAKLLSLPSKIAPVLVDQNEVSTIQEILRKNVYEALTELSDYTPGLFS